MQGTAVGTRLRLFSCCISGSHCVPCSWHPTANSNRFATRDSATYLTCFAAGSISVGCSCRSATLRLGPIRGQVAVTLDDHAGLRLPATEFDEGDPPPRRTTFHGRRWSPRRKRHAGQASPPCSSIRSTDAASFPTVSTPPTLRRTAGRGRASADCRFRFEGSSSSACGAVCPQERAYSGGGQPVGLLRRERPDPPVGPLRDLG